MKTEIWKDIEGFEGLYQVSNLGRVRSLGRTIMRGTRYGTIAPYTIKPRVLMPKICQGGYYQVGLFPMEGKATPAKVHRLVAKAFVPNPDNLPEINHKNEDKSDNRAENLEWVTHIDNCRYGTRNQRGGEKKSKAVIQMDMDGNTISEYPSVIEAQRATGTNRYQIRMCCNGKYKTAGGYRWKFKE